jgi:hypothetical protein
MSVRIQAFHIIPAVLVLTALTVPIGLLGQALN